MFISSIKLFTQQDLKSFDGTKNAKGEDSPIYLSILGKVYDVSKSIHFYGKGNTYNTFAGCDNSRAFITGEFDSKLTSSKVDDFNDDQLIELHEWIEKYKKSYSFVGFLIGDFYDDQARETPYLVSIKERINKAINKSKL